MKDYIFVYDTDLIKKKQLFDFIDKKIFEEKRSTGLGKISQQLWKREKISATGMEAGLGIPHMHSDAIKELTVVVIRNKTPFQDYKCLDQKSVQLVVAFLLPIDADSIHIKILGSISSMFLDFKLINFFLKANPVAIKLKINKLVSNIINSSNISKKHVKKTGTSKIKTDTSKVDSNTKKTNQKRIVAVTSCAVGIAHTYMAGDAIQNYCKSNNILVDVEKQGSLTDKPTLLEDNITHADVVIIAADKSVNLTRFEGKKIYFCSTNKAIKSPAIVLKEAFKSVQFYYSGNTSAITTNLKPKEKKQGLSSTDKSSSAPKNIFNVNSKNKFIQHLLFGISFMIPSIVIGGIFTAIALGFFSNVNQHHVVTFHGFGIVLKSIGMLGFNLYVPILSAAIAYSLAGRAAIVPALVVGWLVGVGTFSNHLSLTTMFNYTTGKFGYGNFLGAPFGSGNYKLGFLGGIATGFVTGFVILIFTEKIIWGSSFRTIVPILVIPLIGTFIVWAIFAFVLVLPLLCIAAGLYNFLVLMRSLNLIWLLALIGGLMIAFDIGGPVNKVAFTFAAGLIQTDPWIMGFIGVAIAIPPLACGLAVLMGYKYKLFDKNDLSLGYTAVLLAFFGITEGAIPFYLKYPKIMPLCCMLASMITASLVSLIYVSDSAAQGGIIVYLIGAVGVNGVTNFVYGLYYLFAILIGGTLGAFFIIISVLIVKGFKRFNRTANLKVTKKLVVKKTSTFPKNIKRSLKLPPLKSKIWLNPQLRRS